MENWVQDEDVLDTWFSSALWPFSTLGWPEDTDDLKRYFPNDVLVTGYDIIFFWVARMAFQIALLHEESSIQRCIDSWTWFVINKAERCAKSLGNGIDPMDVIDTYRCGCIAFLLDDEFDSGAGSALL